MQEIDFTKKSEPAPKLSEAFMDKIEEEIEEKSSGKANSKKEAKSPKKEKSSKSKDSGDDGDDDGGLPPSKPDESRPSQITIEQEMRHSL